MDLSRLAEQGILGLLLTISLGANFFLYRENKNSYNLRLQDYKETIATVSSTLQEVLKANKPIPSSLNKMNALLKKILYKIERKI